MREPCLSEELIRARLVLQGMEEVRVAEEGEDEAEERQVEECASKKYLMTEVRRS